MNSYTRLIAGAGIALGSSALLVGGAADAAIDGPDRDVQMMNLDDGNVVVYADGRVFRRTEQSSSNAHGAVRRPDRRWRHCRRRRATSWPNSPTMG